MRNVPGCCILASTLPPVLVACFTKFCILKISGDAWEKCSCPSLVPSSTTALLTARGRMAKSDRCYSPRSSRRFAKRTMKQVALKRLHTLWTTVLFLLPSRAPVCPRGCLLDVSRLFWPDTASFRSRLLLPPELCDTLEAGHCAGSRA